MAELNGEMAILCSDFHIRLGVLQGSFLEGKLFNLLVDVILAALEKGNINWL